jgi:hypothetical protein
MSMNNLQEHFYQAMTNLRRASRAASVPKDDVRITEVVDGLIVTRPAKKITHIDETKEKESEPEIIGLGGKSKAASAPAVNPVREIFEFLN